MDLQVHSDVVLLSVAVGGGFGLILFIIVVVILLIAVAVVCCCPAYTSGKRHYVKCPFIVISVQISKAWHSTYTCIDLMAHL